MKNFTSFNKIKKIHFVGIKGVAVSALALICKQGGFEVAGSDLKEVFATDKILKQNNIRVYDNFNSENLNWKPDLVVVGASWSQDNIEYKTAKKKNISVISDSDLRGILSRQRETIAVTGVHGKTTTAALLSYIFTLAGQNPSYLIGAANIPDLGFNGRWDSGRHFIVEGDEYIKSLKEKKPKFLDLSPAYSIITSIEWEHVDVYKDVDELEKVFKKLIKKTAQKTIACVDWRSVRNIIKKHQENIITYGSNLDADWQIADFSQDFQQTVFRVKYKNRIFDEFTMKLTGLHNVANALACIIICMENKIGMDIVKEALMKFSGAERRFDIKHYNGVIYVDDYAHHPTEIKTTLRAVKDKYPGRRIWCVFQPHMASRTAALLDEFANSFFTAEKVLIVDIFASAREKASQISSQDLASAVKSYHPDAIYSGNVYQTSEYLKNKIDIGDVLVTMGAGDVYKIRDNLIL